MSRVNSILVYNVFVFLSGVSVFIIPFCTSYALYVVAVSMFGFFTSFVILETIVLVEILGLENLTSAFGLILSFQGLASMIGTPIAGAVYDIAGNYDTSFYIASASFVLASILGLVAQFLQRVQLLKIKAMEVQTISTNL